VLSIVSSFIGFSEVQVAGLGAFCRAFSPATLRATAVLLSTHNALHTGGGS